MLSLFINLASRVSLIAWRILGYLNASRQGVRINDAARISPKARFGKGVTLGRVQIGSNVYVGDGTCLNGGIISAARIGRYCSIAMNVQIGPSEHDHRLAVTSPMLLDQGPGRPPPIIGDDVWIGVNVVILRGITIGNGSVIGAGSVVTKDIPPYTIAAGTPCRVLRSRFANEIDRVEAEAFLRRKLELLNARSVSARS